MGIIESLSEFDFVDVSQPKIMHPCIYEVEVTGGYKAVVIALKTNVADNPRIKVHESAAKFTYDFGVFTVHIMPIGYKMRLPDTDMQDLTKKIMINLFADYANMNVCPNTLLNILQAVKANKIGSSVAAVQVTAKAIQGVCPECHGTKIIDMEFYTRACMRCYKE